MTDLIRTIQSHDRQAVLAGGCVRDSLMGLKPHDYDIATNATPEEVESYFPKTIAIGKSFGVITVLTSYGESYEVATFRNDGQYEDGRRPTSVAFSSMEEDAKRRDLTINGLFLDPISGKVFDFVGGRKDIDDKVLRFIGNPLERIEEDRLRMLRLIRFAVKFPDLTIDRDSFEAVKMNASRIVDISPERIREELLKMFAMDRPRRMLTLLFESGLLHYVLPEVEAYRGTQQNPVYHPEGDVWEHTILALEAITGQLDQPFSDAVRWGVLLHDVGKPIVTDEEMSAKNHSHVGWEMTEAILRDRLKFSNDFVEEVGEAVRYHMTVKEAESMKKSSLKRYLQKKYIDTILLVSYFDSMGSRKQVGWYDYILQKREEWGKEVILPKPLIGGDHLIRMGFKPGPLFKEILEKVSTLQLEDLLTDEAGALAYVKENWVP